MKKNAPTALAQINKLLPQLNVNELEQLAMRAKSLASLDGGGNKTVVLSDQQRADAEDFEVDEKLVLSCITHTMQKLGVDVSSPYMLQKSRDISAFREKLPGLLNFVRSVGRERRMHMAVLTLGIRLLYEEMHNAEYAISSRTMMRHIHRLPAAINRQFPGYARAGCLDRVLRMQIGNLHDA